MSKPGFPSITNEGFSPRSLSLSLSVVPMLYPSMFTRTSSASTVHSIVSQTKLQAEASISHLSCFLFLIIRNGKREEEKGQLGFSEEGIKLFTVIELLMGISNG